MYVQLPPAKCSKCGSTNSEDYQRADCRGTRCLDCGHDNSKRDPTPMEMLREEQLKELRYKAAGREGPTF